VADGHQEVIEAGSMDDALSYEVTDMEKAVSEGYDMHLDYTKDVMKIMTYCRKQWGLTYPEEEK
jgi:hypothetical protein